MSNRYHSVFYTGVSSDLRARVEEHRSGIYKRSFTYRYNLYKLLYYEDFHSIEEAIEREKQVKKYSRLKKKQMIETQNPGWQDLYEKL